MVLAQNKAGINIGDHFNDFDKAASTVGSGGWVVVMACPGDADKIAKMATDHPEINIVIRGHYPGQYPPEENNKLAKLWVASLQSVPFPNRVYFMPWNEPNHDSECGNHACSVEEVKKYVLDLKQKLNDTGLLNNKVILLSPMIDKLNPRFEEFKSIYSLANSSSINEYDQFSPGPCSAGATQNNCLYDQIGIPAPYFALEAGVAGTCLPPCYRDSEIRSMLDRSWQKWGGDSNFKMFAIFSYDPHRTDWDIFSTGTQTVRFLRNIGLAAGGCCTQQIAPSSSTPTLKKCPGKNHSYYVDSESECGECGSMINVCKPIKETDQFGEEISKQSINIPQEARYRKGQDACITANFDGKITLSNFEIPFANNLNKYFLGPFVDNPKARISKTEKDPFKDSGVLEKLLPKDFQDELKLQFIAEVNNRGAKSRYQGFRIEGKDLNSIAGSFRAIREKQKKDLPLSSADQEFLTLVWPQVPLFANEESEGEVVFYGSGFEAGKNKVKTSIPEVYRLDKATEILALMLGAKRSNIEGTKTQSPQVLQAVACPETGNIPPETSSKKTLSGPGDTICTKPEIQEKENNLEGSRTFINDAAESCSENAGGCNWDGEDSSTVENRCCGNKGKCVRKLDSNLIPYYECQEESSPLGCPGGCWLGGTTYANCCVPDYKEKIKQFTDTNLNSKNRVPYLNLIAENTVGKSGLFKIFIPYLSDQYPEGDIKKAFEEVAGESTANVNIEFNPLRVNPGVKFTINNVQTQLTLLFHKLGTLLNVKNFVSGKVLWPHGGGTFPINPKDVPQNMKEFFSQVGSSTGVPAKILEAIMQIESPSFLSLPEEKLNRYLAGELIEGCGPNECSATGPMQMTTGIDNSGSSTCSNCCYPTCLTNCPNAWANYGAGGNPCILKDNVSAAARKLKADSGASSESWTKEQVFLAARGYYGECASTFERLGNRSYCQYVWDYYQGQ